MKKKLSSQQAISIERAWRQDRIVLPLLAPLLALILSVAITAIPLSGQTSQLMIAHLSPELVTGQLLAEILDPCLGQRWELMTDPRHPAGPWRLVLAESRHPVSNHVADRLSDPAAIYPAAIYRIAVNPAGQAPAVDSPSQDEKSARNPALAGGLSGLSAVTQQLVIRAGDRVVVEQRTPVLTARFGAVAMEQAVPGQSFRVRLNTDRKSLGSVGGAVIQVVAVASGQANWSTSFPAQPPPPGRRHILSPDTASASPKVASQP